MASRHERRLASAHGSATVSVPTPTPIDNYSACAPAHPDEEERCTDTTCAGGHPEDHAFYVTVRDAGRTGYLLGPYDTHPEALTNVDRGRRLAIAANDRAWFYAYGTASVTRAAIIKTVFGDTAPASGAVEELTTAPPACDM